VCSYSFFLSRSINSKLAVFELCHYCILWAISSVQAIFNFLCFACIFLQETCGLFWSRLFFPTNSLHNENVCARSKGKFRICIQSAQVGGKVNPTHRPSLPPGRIPGTHFCQRLSWPQGHNATGRIKSLKNSSDSMGNRTRDLPVCSAVPQPTAPPCARSTNWFNVTPLLQFVTCS
jgi:hypothetical protein